MGYIKVRLSDELEKKLRWRIAVRLGMRKGNISLAVQEAVELWLQDPHRQYEEVDKAFSWVKIRKQMKNRGG